MALLTTVATTLLLAIALKVVLKLIVKPSNFPPGPSIIQSTWQIIRNGSKKIQEMADSDQKLVGIIVAKKRWVVINDFAIAKEAMNMEEFSGRNQIEFTLNNNTNGGNYGLISK